MYEGNEVRGLNCPATVCPESSIGGQARMPRTKVILTQVFTNRGEREKTETYLLYTYKMKAIKFMAFLLLVGTTAVFTSCDTEDTVLTHKVTFEGENYNKLIDNPQYQGKLLYSLEPYTWKDDKTSLSGSTAAQEWPGSGIFWSYGTAISNYVDADTVKHATYEYQLSVPVAASGNFAVIWDHATLAFADSTAREFQSIDICPTTYLLGTLLRGGGGAKALTSKTEKSNFTLTIMADQNKDRTINIDLARDGEIQRTWKTFKLNSLGKAKRLDFSFNGSDKNAWGLVTPKYVAIDNVVITL